MRKIINVSLHRSATQSFHNFCLSAGLKSQHWPGKDFDKSCSPALEELNTQYVWDLYKKKVENFDSFCDIPQPFIYKEFMKEYPNGLYILVLRDTSQWIASVRRHTLKRNMDIMEKLQYWTILENRKEHLRDYTDDELSYGYRAHIINVVNASKQYQVELVILNLDDKKFQQKLKDSMKVNMDIEFKSVDITRKK